MAPRWFKNIQFGRDLTNNQAAPNFLENFKANIEKHLQEVTFNSTGPIIEEAESEDELQIEKTLRIEHQPHIEQEPQVEKNTLVEEECQSHHEAEVEEESHSEQNTLTEEESESPIEAEVEEEHQSEHESLAEEESESLHDAEVEEEHQSEHESLAEEESESPIEAEVEEEHQSEHESLAEEESQSLIEAEVEEESETEENTLTDEESESSHEDGVEGEHQTERNTLIEDESQSQHEMDVEKEHQTELNTLPEDEAQSQDEMDLEEENQNERNSTLKEPLHQAESEDEFHIQKTPRIEQASHIDLEPQIGIRHSTLIEEEPQRQAESEDELHIQKTPQIETRQNTLIEESQHQTEVESRPQPGKGQSIRRTQTESGLRRSNRKRLAPLDFARGERPIYKRVGSTFEIVAVDPGFPAKYNYGRGSRPKNSAPQVLKRKTKVRPPSNATPIEAIQFRTAKKGDFLYDCKMHCGDTLMTGAIRILPGKVKPIAQTSYRRQYVFTVKSGQIIFKSTKAKITRTLYADEDSDWILLDAGAQYTVKNCGVVEATIAYIVTEIKE